MDTEDSNFELYLQKCVAYTKTLKQSLGKSFKLNPHF